MIGLAMMAWRIACRRTCWDGLKPPLGPRPGGKWSVDYEYELIIRRLERGEKP